MDEQFLKMILGTALRHGATIAGGWLLKQGIVDNDGQTQFIAAVMLIGGIGWSAWQKYGHAKAQDLIKRLTTAATPKLMLALLSAGLLVQLTLMTTARAADNVPAVTAINKAIAPASNPCGPTGCSGFFVGAEISGSGTGVNVINLGSLNANGTYMGVNGGYQFFNGTYWLGAKVMLDYAVAAPNSGLAPSLSNLFAFEGMEVGGYLSSLFNITPINLPGPLANAVPTLLFGACQHGSLQGYCAGAAAHLFIPNSKWTADATYLNAQYSSSSSLTSTATAPTENRGTFGFSYHF